jgi:peptidyl-prolyl cis-trans isomerase C
MKSSMKMMLPMLMGLLVMSAAPAFGKDAGTAAEATAADKKGDNPTVAIVNGTEIHRDALDRELELVTHRLQSQGRPINQEQQDTIQGKVLDNMIDRELLYQDAIKNGIKPDEKAITAQMDQMKKKFPGEAEYQKALEMMHTTEADLRTNIAQSMVIQQLIEKKIAPGIEITDAQGKEFYDAHPELFQTPEQVKASHILIKADPSDSDETKDEARKKLETVQDKLKKGEKFDALAKEYSEGPSSAKGGDLGYFSKGQMVKPFEDAAFAMDKGEISDIVVTQFGFHLIQVMDKKAASTTSYDDAKPRIVDHLKQQKMIESVNAYVQKIKTDADIQVLL